MRNQALAAASTPRLRPTWRSRARDIATWILRSYKVSRAHFLFLFLATYSVALSVFAGLDTDSWKVRASHGSLAIRLSRIAMLAVVIVLFFEYTVAWRRKHYLSVPDDALAERPAAEELSRDELLGKIRECAAEFAALDGRTIDQLANSIIAPAAARVKVFERVSVTLHQTIHRVGLHYNPHRAPTFGNFNIIPIMRPKRELGVTYYELSVSGGHVLTSFETLGLLFQIMRVSVRNAGFHVDASIELFLTDILSGRYVGNSCDSIARHIGIPQGPSHSLALILLKTLANRNVYFAVIARPERQDLLTRIHFERPPAADFDARLLEYTYRRDFLVLKPEHAVDGWRTFKAQIRKWLRLPSKFVFIPLERAFSSSRFQFYVDCPDHLYVDEANVWSTGLEKWIKPQRRGRNYRSYIGWSMSTARAFVSGGSSNLAAAPPGLKDLILVLRLSEKPPGVLSWASSLAVATTLSIWLVGESSSNGGSSGVDLVAFILAIPALVSAFFGMQFAGHLAGRRSVTGIFSLFACVVLSLLAVVIYVAQSQTLAPLPALEFGTRFYYLDDGIWMTLVALSLTNLILTLGTFLISVARYAQLRVGQADSLDLG